MCRDGRGLGSKLVSFAKRFSKHSHIFPIFKVDSEYLRLPFKLKVDYFILYSILVSTFAIFLLFFFYEQKKTDERSRKQFFYSNVYILKRKQKWKSADYQYVISSKKSSGHHINVSIKCTFYWTLFFLEWSSFSYLSWFHYKNCKNTKQSLRSRIQFFLPHLFPFMTHF